MVEAIKSGDPLAAHQACVDHVRAAAAVALDYLKRKQEETGVAVKGTPAITLPIALKEPRIGQ